MNIAGRSDQIVTRCEHIVRMKIKYSSSKIRVKYKHLKTALIKSTGVAQQPHFTTEYCQSILWKLLYQNGQRFDSKEEEGARTAA